MARARNETYRLLERTQRSQELVELYLIAGQLCVMLAKASSDLGYQVAATEQARTAFVYAESVDHNGLRAFARSI